MNKDLLEGLKNRDAKLLEVIFADVNPYLMKIISANRVFGENAEEILQDSWATFFKNIDRFEGRSQIKVFVAGIVLNKIREQRRQQKKLVVEEDPQKIFDAAFDSEGWWMHEPDDPQALLESKEFLSFLKDCLEDLSPTQREAFVLREVDSEKSEEICNILGITVTHLGVLLFRAKDKLRKCLEGRMGTI